MRIGCSYRTDLRGVIHIVVRVELVSSNVVECAVRCVQRQVGVLRRRWIGRRQLGTGRHDSEGASADGELMISVRTQPRS